MRDHTVEVVGDDDCSIIKVFLRTLLVMSESQSGGRNDDNDGYTTIMTSV